MNPSTDQPLRLCVAGANGRMGRTLVRLLAERNDLTLRAATTHPDDPDLGKDVGLGAGIGALGIALSANIPGALEDVDGIVDFTTPQSTLLHGREMARRGGFLVSGTTGLDGLAMTALEALAARMPVLHAGNFSIGIALLCSLVERATRALGPAFDVEILDLHHRRKVDAPSGTALMLGEAAAKARGQALRDVAVRGRDGMTGAREEGAIGIAALRGGSVIGQHDVILAGPGERLTLSHMAEDRGLFAEGALRAAAWLAGRPAALYSVSDMLEAELDGR